MSRPPEEERFLRYQLRAIRRFQSIRDPSTPQEADMLALEWIQRFAAAARLRWVDRLSRRDALALPGDRGAREQEQGIGQWNI